MDVASQHRAYAGADAARSNPWVVGGVHDALRQSDVVGRAGTTGALPGIGSSFELGNPKIQRQGSGQQPARIRRLFGLVASQQLIHYYSGAVHVGFEGLGYAYQGTGGR